MRGNLLQVESKRAAVFLSLLCFSVYTVSYIGRLNYSAALTEMIATNLLSKTQGGAIATAYFLCYGIGQLLNGFLADRYDPIRQVSIGILGSTLLNLLMVSTENYLLMLVIWGCNGYFQSLIWAPVFLIVSQSIPVVWRSKALLLLNTAAPAGAVFAFSFSSLLLWKKAWQDVFTGAAICMGVFAVVWMVGCKQIYRNARPTQVTPQEQPRPAGDKPAPHTQQSLLRMLLLSGGVCLILPAMIHGMLKDGITTWLPTYMTEVFSMPSQMAVAFSIFLPLVNMLGAVIAYILMRRIKNEVVCTLLFFSVAGGSLAVLKLAGSSNPFLTIALFSVVTVAMMAANVLFCCEVPSHFARQGKSATVSGFYNSCGYLGTAVSMYVIAYVSGRFGWDVTQTLWIGACIGAILCCAAVLPVWNAFLARSIAKETQ